jgi:hypothetical protein
VVGGLDDQSNDPKDIARECRQIVALAANVRAFSEPMHRAAAGLFKNCGAAGEQFYLDMLDPEWRDAGQDKMDRWTAGPTTCAHFEKVNADGCNGCPHRGKITSPIQLGRISAQRANHDFLFNMHRRL